MGVKLPKSGQKQEKRKRIKKLICSVRIAEPSCWKGARFCAVCGTPVESAEDDRADLAALSETEGPAIEEA